MGDELSFHPLAELFPLLPEGELQQLADDIKANGQRDDIWLSDDGRIIDGRNRYRACRRAGVEPRTQTYDGPDALAFVLSKNLHRRHLTESQRASAAAKIATLKIGDNQFCLQNKDREGGTIVPPSPPAAPVSDAKAAEMLHVSEKSVERAKKLQREGVPELSVMVDAGDVSINAALELCRLTPSEQKKVASGGAAAVKEKVKKLREEAKGSRGSRSAPATKNKSGSEPVKQDGGKSGGEADEGTPGQEDTPEHPAEFVQSVESLCRDLDQIVARVKALKDSPLSYSMHWQGATDQVSAARKTLWVGRPAFPCPYCEFNGETKADCTACRGTGRVKKDTRERGLEAVGGAR